MVETVIVLPGIMGSELFKDGRLIWPGSVGELLFPYSKMKELLDPDLEVGEIIRHVSISEQYDGLLDALKACGFQSTGPRPKVRTCPYDWRKDNAIAARLLAEQVRAMRDDHGPDLRINLVAHSMGGLVARYFLESGKFDENTCKGFANIALLATIGTPHRGAPLALCAAVGQIKRLFLSADQVRELAAKPEFPSLYQLMPPPSEPFLWNVDPEARLEPASPYDTEVCKRLNLSEANLASAAAFHAGLDVTKRPKTVSYFCFVGTREETICNVQADFGRPATIQPVGIEISDGGDGTVPSWSASFPGIRQLAVGGEHGGLYKNTDVLHTLGALLGKPGILAIESDPDLVRISLPEVVLEPHTVTRVSIIMNAMRTSLDADLVLRKRAGRDGIELPISEEIGRLPVEYSGVPVDALSLAFTSPAYAGIYTLDVESAGSSIAEEVAVLFVQC